jgi:hypothetical protein
MKRIHILTVLLAVTAAAGFVYGQEPSGTPSPRPVITIDAVTQAFFQKTDTGDFAIPAYERDAADFHVYEYQGSDASGAFNLSKELFDTSDLRLDFVYNTDTWGGRLRLAGDDKTTGSSTALSWSDFINRYYAWVKIPISAAYLKLWTGNDDYYGGVQQFLNFDDFLVVRNDGFGPALVSFDTARHTLSAAGSDVTNLRTTADNRVVNVFALETGFKDLAKLTFAANSLWSEVNTLVTTGMPSFATIGQNFAIRAEGTNLFNMLTIAGLYKYNKTDVDYGTKTNDGTDIDWERDYGTKGISHHAFGLYATLTPPVQGLAFTLGYTGYLKQHEDWGDVSYQFPFIHAVDLWGAWTGLPGLKVTLANNLTLSLAEGDDDPNTWNWGFYTTETAAWVGHEDVQIANRASEGLFSLYNALGADYALRETLTLTLQVSNRYSQIYSRYNGDTRYIDTLNQSAGYLGALWQIAPAVSLRGGAVVKWEQYTSSAIAGTADAGYLTWGLPVGLKVSF